MSTYFIFKVTTTEVHEVRSNQEETDTRVIVYLHYAARLGYKAAVVRSPDTDIFFLLLYHAKDIELTVYGDIGAKSKRKLYNITELASSLGAPYCTALLGLYVFTGEDATSAFRGKGKVDPLKKLQRSQHYQETFRFVLLFIHHPVYVENTY